MDTVEAWMVEQARKRATDDLAFPQSVIEQLASEWHNNPPVTAVTYEPDNPLAEFLDKVEGPAMIGLDPVIYPACVVCSQAWMMRRTRGTWAWAPDCAHKNAHCKLVRA